MGKSTKQFDGFNSYQAFSIFGEMDNHDKKRLIIIEAAVKRFSHFGLAKTTMSEIASDISLSKALLYYYFPDKISLYAAVMDHIIREIETEMEAEVKSIKSAKKAILHFLERRQNFLRKYYNLLDINKLTGPKIPADVMNIFRRARQSEHKLISSLLGAGKKNKEFRLQKPDIVAEILLSAVTGIRTNHQLFETEFFPSQEQHEEILKKEKQLAEIFLKGLSV